MIESCSRAKPSSARLVMATRATACDARQEHETTQIATALGDVHGEEPLLPGAIICVWNAIAQSTTPPTAEASPTRTTHLQCCCAMRTRQEILQIMRMRCRGHTEHKHASRRRLAFSLAALALRRHWCDHSCVTAGGSSRSGEPHASAPAAPAQCVRDGPVCTVLASVCTNGARLAPTLPPAATRRRSQPRI